MGATATGEQARHSPTPGGAGEHAGISPVHLSPHLALRAACEIYEDAQKLRIASENRVRNAPIDGDLLMGHLEGLRRTEHLLGLYMRRTFRHDFPELYLWTKDTPGVGEHLMARLIAHIGHPVHTIVHAWEGEGSERELVVVGPMRRRVSNLWSYCGHGDAKRRRKAGMSAEEAAALGSPAAKMLTRLIAEGCTKFTGEDGRRRSPFRDTYEEGRERYADRDWTPGHQHAAALRLVGKEFLKELWLAAGGGSDNGNGNAHRNSGPDGSSPGGRDAAATQGGHQ